MSSLCRLTFGRYAGIATEFCQRKIKVQGIKNFKTPIN